MKQAFLITAYNHFEHLEKLIRFLDGKDVFFYLYIDAKVDTPHRIANLSTANPLTILHELRVEWGDRSQIITELDLFQKAYENEEIEWFHLISGTDFPLKKQEEILRVFENAQDVDGFMEFEPLPAHLSDRVEIYHLRVRRGSEMGALETFLQSKFRSLQRKIGIRRKAPRGLQFMYGSNWVDLRRTAVEQLLNERERIIRATRHTQIANEVYKQTFLQNKGLRFVNDNLRYIDWSECLPSPKSLGPDDFSAIMASDKIFARKFDSERSAELRDRIIEALSTSE